MAHTEIVTLLFTDLVSSTEVFARTEDDGSSLRHAHFGVLREAVAEHAGREVKNLGDGLMCVFPTASAALDSAVRMQQLVERDGRRSRPLGLRIGVHLGEVTVEDDDYFGTPVALAERLCKAAGPGKIVASEIVRALAGRGHEFRPLGALDLKGIDEPVEAVEVAWTRDDRPSGPIPLPPSLEAIERGFFVGREREQALLWKLYQNAASGERTIAFISGEPGAGKTRLAAELAFEAASGGAVVLFGRCDAELSIPYQPFAEGLRHYAAHCDLAILERHVAEYGGELTRLAPEIARRVEGVPPPVGDVATRDGDAEAVRMVLLEASTDLLLRDAEGPPIVFVLDDLHWAHKPALLMLRHLLARSEGRRLMLVATYRDTDLSRAHPLAEALADLRRDPAAHRIDVAGLDVAGVVAFVQAAAGEALDDRGLALAAAVGRETDGNPFFVGQVLRHLSETARIVRRDGRWTYDGDVEHLGLPEGVREVVGRRLSRMAESTGRVLQVAAVAGTNFDADVVGLAVEGVSADELLDALDEAARSRIVQELPDQPGGYRFVHSLVRQTLYEELSSIRRVRMHARIVEAIETRHAHSLDAHLAALAHHSAEGARVGHTAKAAGYAAQAGRRALDRAAYEEALHLAETGLQVLEMGDPQPALEAELCLVLALAQRLVAPGPRVIDLLERAARAARTAGSAVLEGEVASTLIVSMPPSGYSHAREIVGGALANLGDQDLALRARLLSVAAFWSRQDASPDEDPDQMALEAMRVADRSGIEMAIRTSRSFRIAIMLDRSTREDSLAVADEAVAAQGPGPSRPFSFEWRSAVRIAFGDRAGFEADSRASDAEGRWLGRSAGHAGLGARITCAILDGAFDEAARLQQEYQERFAAIPVLLYTASARLAWLRSEEGRLEDASELCRLGIAVQPRVAAWSAFLAKTLAENGDHDDALRRIDDLRADDFELVRFGNYAVFVCVQLAEAAAWLGLRDVAEFVLETVAALPDKLAVVGNVWAVGGSTHRAAGVAGAILGRQEFAREQFEAALALEESVGAVLATRTRYWQGWAMLEAGEREAGTAALERTRRDADAFGMGAVAAAASNLLATGGGGQA